ncbi:WSCD family member AAEL009094-like [Ischnura elegans]|uniref:WSCD family member AAEL009094-like n=1 Tax=Ischnura elegans TaxID=197161 RepID=UPI001ED89EFE|nr:WSCD family member AAEL009094-like [Ischnura elegans]XP_046406511.1 WSCD family member AAEL009094-like [Ischnura elegans]
MSPFLKVMQLFLMMTGTVLGMLILLLVTPDLEDTMLRAVRRYHKRNQQPPAPPDTNRLLDSVEGRRENDVGGEGAFLENEKYHLVAGPQLDLGRRSFAPWPGSEQCGHFHVHFARQKSLPMTALVSFPGSGNTWVRYLLEASSGIFTGSVYTDRQLISKGFYGEAVPADCGCTAVQKTHGFALAGRVPAGAVQRAAEVALFRGRAVLLLRNPYEALLSYRNFLYAGHTGFAPHDRFRGPEWERFASRLAVVWRELAATWINVSRSDAGGERPAATVLHFERLRLDPGGSLRRLLAFLKLPRDPERIACALSHLDGPFRRPLRSPQRALFQIRDPFSADLHRILDAAIADVDHMLIKRGWGRAPTHLYKFYGGGRRRGGRGEWRRGRHNASRALHPGPMDAAPAG